MSFNVVYNKDLQKVPVKIWSELHTVESSALDQLKNIASLPFVFKHVAAMPDVHLGKGATVGSVVATKGAVIPAAVGVDIGCGMLAIKLEFPLEIIKERVSEIRSAIEAAVPVGHESNKSLSKSVENWTGWKAWDSLYATKLHRIQEKDLKDKAARQLSSLGGGNHFIELCEDTEGNCWIMLHSGSRNIGKTLAEIHIDRAKDSMKKLFITLPDPDLAYFAESTPEYDYYIKDLIWAQDYAAQNREVMIENILVSISKVLGIQVLTSTRINCHHNYASKENHYGENVLITRKGAVRARQGDMGIIPGSMGTKSYIVEGLGNKESFMSCSHGAGRRMSRSEAKRRFTLEDLTSQTEGVNCRKDGGVLDEIPGAYKNIDEVMENQKDLVKIVATLKQFMCIKG